MNYISNNLCVISSFVSNVIIVSKPDEYILKPFDDLKHSEYILFTKDNNIIVYVLFLKRGKKISLKSVEQVYNFLQILQKRDNKTFCKIVGLLVEIAKKYFLQDFVNFNKQKLEKIKNGFI